MLPRPDARLPRPILDYWRKAFDGRSVVAHGDFTLALTPTLNRKRPAMMLEGLDGSMRAALTLELAEAIGADNAGGMTIVGLRERLTKAGIVLHDPDLLFYLPSDASPTTDQPTAPRQLTEADRQAFDAFQADAREKGHARAVVQAISQFARRQDHEPQYRCQLDNRASIALAKAYGLMLFGKWVVASDPP